MPMYSVRPVTTFAATRSFGVLETIGRIAPITGLVNVMHVATTAPAAYTVNGRSAHIAAAVAIIDSDCAT